MSLEEKLNKKQYPQIEKEKRELTVEKVNSVFEENYEIVFRKRAEEKGRESIKGEIDPAAFEIIIYLDNAESERDKDISLLHEFIHAVDEVSEVDDSNASNCREAEKEAIGIYNEKP